MTTTHKYRSAFREDLFSGQIALVTGGGTGIGRCVAHELAELGATVVVAGRRVEPLERTVAEIADAGGVAEALTLDVRREADVPPAFEGVVARHGRLDLLVNNAGGQFPAPAEAITPNGWRSVVDLNLNAAFLVSRAAHLAWMGAHGGAIVSVVAEMWNGFPYMAHTGAARAGVVNLTKTLAVEWAPSAIRVNAVAPGLIVTSGMDTYEPRFVELAARNVRATPAGRPGTESEVSAAVVFLLSPAAAYISGATLRVDGGSSLTKPTVVPLGNHEGPARFDGFHLASPWPEVWGPQT